MSSPNPSRLTELVRIAYLAVDQVDGCVFNSVLHKWIQNAPPPGKITIHVRAVNWLPGPLDRAAISATWVSTSIDTRLSETFELKSGASYAVSFDFDPLIGNNIGALYLDLLETNPPWNPQAPVQVGVGLVLRFETGDHWLEIVKRLVRQPS